MEILPGVLCFMAGMLGAMFGGWRGGAIAVFAIYAGASYQ